MAPICKSAQEMNCVEQVFISLLNNCKNLNSFRQIHAHATKLGLDSDPFIAGKLILHCAVNLSDATHYARLLLHHQPNPDAFMYNALIRGHSDSNSSQNSISIFKLMIKNSNLRPDSFSFAFILKAAANLQCFRTGSQLHCQALTRGFNSHLFVATTLISMYAECGHVLFSKNVFDEIPDPNVVTWNAMLTAFIRCNDIIRAERVFSFMPTKGLDSYNVMLAGYTKTGELKKAMTLFTEMPMRDEVSWSTIIVGCAQNGLLNEAFGLFHELRRMEMRPNEASLTGILSACAQAGGLRFANILHGFIIKVGLLYITSLNNALIDTYSKCGSVNMACLVFDRMLCGKDVVTWTSMIAGLAMQGYGEEAISLFHEMENFGIKPDGIAFITILYACSHAGLVEQGREIFDNMKRVYAIEPTVEHYGCMVDLYSRAGELQKAYDFILHMPIPPNAVVWRTLLGACSFWGDVKLAEVVKESLSKVDPNDYCDHVLLSNIYALAGKWKEVANARTSMGEMKMKKAPAWSTIELDKFNREIT